MLHRNKLRQVVALVTASLSVATCPARAQTLVIKGAHEVTLALRTLPRSTLVVHDPTDGKKRKRLVGASLEAVRARAAPTGGAGADTLLLRCEDGWLSRLPLAGLGALPDAVFAWAEESGQGGQGEVPLGRPHGPVFFALPDGFEPRLPSGVDAHSLADNGFAWAVASVEFGSEATVLAPLALPTTRLDGKGLPLANRAVPAERGRALFARHCLHCHAFKGSGGLAGWDLGAPNVLGYRDEARVRAYVLEPRRLNPDGRMPSFAGKLAAGEIADVIAFLRAHLHADGPKPTPATGGGDKAAPVRR